MYNVDVQKIMVGYYMQNKIGQIVFILCLQISKIDKDYFKATKS